MNDKQNDLSLLMYDYLCKVIGSKDVVKTRRRIFNAMDFVHSTWAGKRISSGSKAEGLDLQGSDYDVMFVDEHFMVYERIKDADESETVKSEIPLIMDTNDTKPGYTRLKLYDRNHRNLPLVNEWCESYGETHYIASNLLRKCFVGTWNEHGPSLSLTNGSFDGTYGFHCTKWITPAQQWIYRSRSSWPKSNLCGKIVDHGVLFVPVGSKNSPYEHLEFRISFNVAEKLLIHSFSHTQLQCYALLKIILKEFIKPNHEDALCSYFLKTIMLWVSEESQQSDWIPCNLLKCFESCLKRLAYCVTHETCLHYFIPENNMFEDRFTRAEYTSLSSILNYHQSLGWQCLLHTSSLQSFGSMLQPSPVTHIPTASVLPCIFYMRFIQLNLEDETHEAYKNSIFGNLYLPGKQMFTLLSSRTNSMSAQYMDISTGTNKERYRKYRKSLCHLLQGLNHDAVSGWLLLASFFYKCKQYRQCIDIVNYCLQKCTPDKILLHPEINIEEQHTFNRLMQGNGKNGLIRTCRQGVIESAIFTDPSNILPSELVSGSGEEYPEFPVVLFAHFLNFLSLHRLRRDTEKRNALRDMKLTLREMYFMIGNDYMIDIANKCIATAEQLL